MKTLLKKNFLLRAFRHVWPGCVFFMIFSLPIAACFNPLSGKGENAEFSISFGGVSGGGISKAVAYPPDENPGSAALLKFTAIFAPAGGGEARRFSSSGNDTVTGMIPAGTYNVSVEITLLSNGSLFAKGDAVNNPVAISAGSPNTIEVEVEQTKFSVSFDANGGDGTAPAPFSGILSTHDIPRALPGGTGMTKNDAFFDSWNTQADGLGTTYAAGEIFAPHGDITLYAIWVSIGTNPFIGVSSSGLDSLRVNQTVSGAKIIFTLYNANYADPITASGFVVSGLPAGLGAGTAVREISGTEVSVSITGTPTAAGSIVVNLPDNIPMANVSGAVAAIEVNGTIGLTVAKDNGAAAGTPAVSAGTTTAYSITVNAVSLSPGTTGQTAEYAINQSNTTAPVSGWGTARTFDNRTPSTAYRVWARSAENDNYLAGTPAVSAAITTLAAPTIAVTATGLGSLQVSQAVSGSIVYTLSNGTYAASITAANFTVSGLPAGLGAGTATRTSNTVITIPITGTPTTYSAGQVTLTRATSIPAANVTGATGPITPTGTITASAVAKGAGAAVSGPPALVGNTTSSSITVSSVTNSGSTGQTVEYAASTTSGFTPSIGWQSGVTFSNLNAATTYYVYARTAENTNYNAGPALQSDGIQTALAPAITVGTVVLSSLSVGSPINPVSVVYTLANGTYANTITPGDFVLSNLPDGLTQDPAARNGLGTTVTVIIRGAPKAANASSTTVNLPTTIPSGNVNLATAPIAVTGSITAGPIDKGTGGYAYIDYDNRIVTSNSIMISGTVSTNQPIEFAINNTYDAPTSGWQLGTPGYTFSGLSPGTTYYIFARSAENANYYAQALSPDWRSITTNP